MAVVEDIVARGLRAGDRLPAEREMVESFGVARGSLREGLRVLETYGVITIRQGQRRGPEVGPLSPSDLARALSLFARVEGATYRDVLDARLVIEPVMARLAAERDDDEMAEKLRRLLETEKSTSDREYIAASYEFHQFISGVSGNPVLDLVGRALRALYADRFFDVRGYLEDATPLCRKAHQMIGAAILSGRGARAETLVADHLVELVQLQDERTASVMGERVVWKA
jgi:GntR family transcriptional repressor for pyruvate dehydrogenase complex